MGRSGFVTITHKRIGHVTIEARKKVGEIKRVAR